MSKRAINHKTNHQTWYSKEPFLVGIPLLLSTLFCFSLIMMTAAPKSLTHIPASRHYVPHVSQPVKNLPVSAYPSSSKLDTVDVPVAAPSTPAQTGATATSPEESQQTTTPQPSVTAKSSAQGALTVSQLQQQLHKLLGGR